MTADSLGPCETDHRRARIVALAESLRGDGYAPEVDEHDAQLIVRHGSGPRVVVRCERRASDAGRLWFVFPPGEPIAEAGGVHLADARMQIRARAQAFASLAGSDGPVRPRPG